MTDRIISHFSVYLAGNESEPGKVSVSEVVQLLKAAQSLAIAMVRQEYPDIDIRTLAINPLNLESGSLAITFTAPRFDIIQPAMARASRAIIDNNYDTLSEEARESINMLLSVARKRNGSIELRTPGERPGILTPATIISVPTISERTTLYGYVFDVGRKVPRVRLRLLNDTMVSCPVDVPMARTIGQYLYMWRGFSGVAHWNPRTLEMVRFEIEEILPFEDTPPDEAFHDLRTQFGQYFDEIDDPVAFVASLRDDDMEE